MNITEGKANIGKLVHVTDGTPRPPERFNKKMETWKHTNYSGVLTEVKPNWDNTGYQRGITTLNKGYMVVVQSGDLETVIAGEHPLAPADLTVKANV